MTWKNGGEFETQNSLILISIYKNF